MCVLDLNCFVVLVEKVLFFVLTFVAYWNGDYDTVFLVLINPIYFALVI